MLDRILNTGLRVGEWVAPSVASIVITVVAANVANRAFRPLFQQWQTQADFEANSTKLAILMSATFTVGMTPVMLLSDSAPLKFATGTVTGIFCRSVYENPSFTVGGGRPEGTPVLDFVGDHMGIQLLI